MANPLLLARAAAVLADDNTSKTMGWIIVGYFDAIYAAELPHRDVAVYMYLKHRANAEGRCWPSVRTIAKDLNLSRATVQRALRELQQGGWIMAEPRWRENGSCTSNSYRLL